MKQQFVRHRNHFCHKLPINDGIRYRIAKGSIKQSIAMAREKEERFKPILQQMINDRYRDEDPAWYIYFSSQGEVIYKLYYYNEEPTVPYITITMKNLFLKRDGLTIS